MAITRPQLIKVNRALNERDMLLKTNEKLSLSLALSDSLCNYWRLTSAKKDTLFLCADEKFRNAQLVNEALEESLKRKKYNGIGIGVGVGVGGAAIGLLIGLLLSK